MKMASPKQAPPKFYKSRNADDKQGEIYKKFPTTSFLGNDRNVDHVLKWNTFFRRNLHRVAIDYLGINLYPYQVLTLYMMGICNFVVIIASRAAAKSFIIALYACCRCIVYPHSRIVLSSAKYVGALIRNNQATNRGVSVKPTMTRVIPRAATSYAVCNA